MRKNVTEIKGTVGYKLNQNKNEIFALMQSKNQFNELKDKINSLLSNEDEFNSKSDLHNELCKLHKAEANYNLYISTLTTFFTGTKV